MSSEPVLVAVDPRGVATVTLNRPEVNNAYNGALIVALHDAVKRLGDDDAVRVICLRGNGRHFQAGADLEWIRGVAGEGPQENEAVSRRTAHALHDLDQVSKPTVALVHGGCFGGGVGLIASCDIVVATEDAMFGITEARWGLTAAIIVPQLVAVMGARHVRRYALTNERFGAAEALAMGLVSEVCPADGLGAAAAPIVEHLLLSAPIAMADTKRTVLAQVGPASGRPDLDTLIAEHAAKRRTEEAAEGLASFSERRDPAWHPGRAD